MKRKNTSRNALVTSVLSLLMCVSMLVGTTFAWFTDEVVSGMNTIAAGNLDVDLLVDGTPVTANTPLFSGVEKWEPGVVVYENIQVANIGTLALKYQMTINFGNENHLNGHRLSEVLQVAVIDKVADNAKRADVLAAAKDAIVDFGNDASLGNFFLRGELEAGAVSEEQTIVIFWAPNAPEIDNLYNANNNQTTSNGQPLSIEFGLNLQATQKMSESDSFGQDYDDFASVLPNAIVNNVSNVYSLVDATEGIGGPETQVPMDFVLQFLPNETFDEAMTSAYKYYNVDFVIKADKDVPANSIALTGFYSAWCDGYNDSLWVTLTSSEAVTAGTEIRLVEGMGQGAIKVSYKDICQYAVRPENTIDGFLCGATDLTGENAGTTITVELRMYETTSDPMDSSNTGSEVGPDAYTVIGVYKYTF